MNANRKSIHRLWIDLLRINLVVSMVLVLTFVPGVTSAQASGPVLLGRWTFEGANPLAESTGNWGDLVLVGNATIANGQLDTNGSGTTSTGWAYAQGYTGPTIREKTLVSWVSLDSLDAWAGSALTIDSIGSDNFDAIVFAEREQWKWMAGSSFFLRTQDVVSVDDTELNGVRQMAISYKDLGGGEVEITICRNGVQLGQYTSSSMTEWSAGDAEVFFGLRHGNTLGGPGALDAHISEARIYGNALSCDEVWALNDIWTLTGFYQPVNMNALNTVKGGSTVPLKFNVYEGDTELTNTSVVKSFTTQLYPCDGGLLEDPVAVDVTTTGNTSLRYDTTGRQFIQNWKTPTNPGECYLVTMTTQDYSTIVARFKLR